MLPPKEFANLLIIAGFLAPLWFPVVRFVISLFRKHKSKARAYVWCYAVTFVWAAGWVSYQMVIQVPSGIGYVNGENNPVSFLGTGKQIVIFRARADSIAHLVSRASELQPIQLLAEQPRTPKKHLGWWYEQYVLYSEQKQWRWNTAAADKSLAKIFPL